MNYGFLVQTNRKKKEKLKFSAVLQRALFLRKYLALVHDARSLLRSASHGLVMASSWPRANIFLSGSQSNSNRTIQSKSTEFLVFTWQ